MPAERGFTLIEVIVAATCSTVLLLALASLSSSLLLWMGRLDDVLERDENLDLIPLILAPLLAQAGNNQDSFPAPSLELRQDELVARSDTSGPERFPDGLLTHPFELVRLRVQNDQLQMKSGEGSYQPLLADVAAASWLREGETLLHLDVQSTASGPGSGALSRRQFPFLLYLPNLQPALFPA